MVSPENRFPAADSTPPVPARAAAPAPDTLEMYRLLVDRIEDYAIFLLDPEGRITTWNAGAERLKGWRSEEIVGRSFTNFYGPEDRAAGKPARLLQQALRDGRVEDEGWRVRKDGSRFWADVIITALYDHHGVHRGFAKITRDLTDQRQAEEALQRSEEQLRLLIAGVQDYAIMALDPAGRVTTWNIGAERIKGYRPDEVIGRSFELFYAPEDRAAGKPARLLQQALRDGRVEDEGWRVRKDGTRFWADSILTPLFGTDGAHRGFAKITRDLTERRAAEDLRVQNERLRELARMKAQFVNTVSHELRTPLTPVLLQLEVLRSEDKAWPPRERRAFDILARNLQRLALLVEDVLEVGRLDSGRLSLIAAPVDLREVAREAVESFRDAAAEKGLRLQLEPGAPAPVEADGRRLAQVLYNLLSNALRFTPRGGEVRVALSPEGAGWRVEVRDTGVGLTAAQRERLFQPFSQVHDLDAGPSGTGLGLYITKGLVEAHGGRVWATSEGPGKGSTFGFTLPPRPTPGGGPPPPAGAAPPGETASL